MLHTNDNECQNSSFLYGFYRKLLGRKKLKKDGEKGFSHAFLFAYNLIAAFSWLNLSIFFSQFCYGKDNGSCSLLWKVACRMCHRCSYGCGQRHFGAVYVGPSPGLLLLAGLPVDKTLGRIVGITILGKNSLSHLCGMDFMFEWQKWYRFCHKNMKFLSFRQRTMFFLLYGDQIYLILLFSVFISMVSDWLDDFRMFLFD